MDAVIDCHSRQMLPSVLHTFILPRHALISSMMPTMTTMEQKNGWTASVMRVLKRRLQEGTLRERVFRLPPVTEQPDSDIELVWRAPPVMAERRPDPVAEYAKAYAPGTRMEELLQFPTADPVEDEIVYVPTKAEMETADTMADDDIPAELLYMASSWNEQVTRVQSVRSHRVVPKLRCKIRAQMQARVSGPVYGAARARFMNRCSASICPHAVFWGVFVRAARFTQLE